MDVESIPNTNDQSTLGACAEGRGGGRDNNITIGHMYRVTTPHKPLSLRGLFNRAVRRPGVNKKEEILDSRVDTYFRTLDREGRCINLRPCKEVSCVKLYQSACPFNAAMSQVREMLPA